MSRNLKLILASTVAFFFCAIMVLSCSKPEEPALDFRIDGLKNVVLDENGSEVVPLSIMLVSGTPEQITLSIEGLPDGVSASFNISTGSPNFDVELYIKDDSSYSGTKEVTLKAKSASGVIHPYTFKVTTLEKTCTKKATGLYEGTSTCRDGNGQIYGNINFLEDPDRNDRLYFVWQQSALHLDVNCNTKRFTLPLQTFGDIKISGDGYLDENYTLIRIDYKEWHSNGDTITCNAIFRKK